MHSKYNKYASCLPIGLFITFVHTDIHLAPKFQRSQTEQKILRATQLNRDVQLLSVFKGTPAVLFKLKKYTFAC